MLNTIIGMLYTSIWLYLKKKISLFLPIHLKYLLIKAQFLKEIILGQAVVEEISSDFAFEQSFDLLILCLPNVNELS